MQDIYLFKPFKTKKNFDLIFQFVEKYVKKFFLNSSLKPLIPKFE
jgi:hypothetical protein